MKTLLLRLLVPALLAGSACAQGFIQNRDISVLGGVSWYKSQSIPGSSVTFDGSTGYAMQVSYGYQVARGSAGSLWVEFYPMTFPFPGKRPAGIPGKVDFSSFIVTPGVRYMVPVQSRLSLYGVAGGGYGAFEYPVVADGDTLHVKMNSTWHGVFDFGGGIDVRLSQSWSLRTECRDFVTGRALNGIPGRHHPTPLLGIAVHF
jgi:opacity protein-like surface antigen